MFLRKYKKKSNNFYFLEKNIIFDKPCVILSLMKGVKYIFASVLSLILRVRHFLFDIGILKTKSFDVPIICVGNLKVGGTGKTPMTEFLVSSLKKQYNIAVLSRGYRRKSKGFKLSDETSTSADIGDEPMLIHLRHPEVMVAVCEKRVKGVENILKADPTINLIILDDAFQHRYIDTTIDILLTEYDNPYIKDYLLPYGNLRDLRCQADRASYIVVTKCPENVKPIELRTFMSDLKLRPYQSLFFTYMDEGQVFPLFDRGYEEPIKTILRGDNVVMMTAIANPTYLIASVKSRYNIVHSFRFKDHHNFTQTELNSILAKAIEENAHIIMTEKDAAKIMSLEVPSSEKFRFCVAPITIDFIDGEKSGNRSYFIKSISKRLNSKDGKYCIYNKQFNS